MEQEQNDRVISVDMSAPDGDDAADEEVAEQDGDAAAAGEVTAQDGSTESARQGRSRRKEKRRKKREQVQESVEQTRDELQENISQKREELQENISQKREEVQENIAEAKENLEKEIELEREAQKKVKFSLVFKILLFSVLPFLVVSVALTAIGVSNMRSGFKKQIMDELDAMIAAVDASMNTISTGGYSMDAYGGFHKGGFNISENMDFLDRLVEGTDVDITFYYGNTRQATTLTDPDTGERLIGTEGDEEVYQHVGVNGEKYEGENLIINGQSYYATYVPLYDMEGTEVVGMLFMGIPSEDVTEFIVQRTMILIIAAVIIAVIALLIIIINVISIRRGLVSANAEVSNLARGDLRTQGSDRTAKRGDELGMIAREIQALRTELVHTIGQVHDASNRLLDAGKNLSDMASQTSATADDIGHAVEDISKGAVSQAEQIENASAQISEMGDVIQDIVRSVEQLDGISAEMKSSGDRSVEIVTELGDSNDRTMEAIRRIGAQVVATNESAGKIREAIDIITSIADETNLLSLNASIEAARAGEQGRGFAVVANQIQKLAEQSTESAQKIAEIIKELLADSEQTVQVMNDVRVIVDEQHAKLEQTKTQFKDVSDGIDTSKDETASIKTKTEVCNGSRVQVVDAITDLSAISEQNAASTQETTASMEELNATINLVAESAHSLTEMSEALEKEIEFFQL